MKRDRNGETLIQQMLQEYEPELEETYIAAIRAMNDPQPVVAVRQHAQIDHPQVAAHPLGYEAQCYAPVRSVNSMPS